MTAMPDTDVSPVAHAQIAELRRLQEALAPRAVAMTAADLRRASACSDWDVSQVLSHLGSSSEIGLAGLEAAALGEPAPDQDFSKAVWARWDAASPEQRRDEWAQWSERYLQHLESQSDAQLAALAMQPSWSPRALDAAEVTGMRVTEVALHSWDIDVAFDAAAAIDDLAAELVLPRLPGMMRWAAKPDRWTGSPATVHVTTTAPASEWILSIAPGEATLTGAGAPAAGDVTMTLPAETFIRLVAGRFRDGDVARVSGSADIAALRPVFPGF